MKPVEKAVTTAVSDVSKALSTDDAKKAMAIAAAYYLPGVGASLGQTLVTQGLITGAAVPYAAAIGTALASTGASVAQGVPFDTALTNATVNAVTSTGSQSVAGYISKLGASPEVANAVTSVGASGLATAAKGGSAADIERNMTGALAGSTITSMTGDKIAGAAVGGQITGGTTGALIGAAGAAGAAAAPAAAGAAGYAPIIASNAATAAPAAAAAANPLSTAFEGFKALGTEGGRSAFMAGMGQTPYSGVASLGSTAMGSYYDQLEKMSELGGGAKNAGLIRPYTLERDVSSTPDAYGRYFQDVYTAGTPYKAPGSEYRAATGGLLALSNGGLPVEEMSRNAAIGANTRYPMANQTTPSYATPAERPISENLINPPGYLPTDPYTGAQRFADGGTVSFATGGVGYNNSTGQMDASKASANPAEDTTSAKYAGWGKTKKIMSPEDITSIWQRMGGTGEVPADYMQKVAGNKRSEEDIAKSIKSLPYFTNKFQYKKQIAMTPENKAVVDKIAAERINGVANAMLGRNATPEEIASLMKSDFTLAGVRDYFGKNAKGEVAAYQQKAFEQRGKTATESAETAKQAAFAADPKNQAKPTDVANIFRQTFGRAPTSEELNKYTSMKTTPEKVKEAMMGTDLYTQKLTGQTSGVGTPKFTLGAAGQQQLAGALAAPKSATEQLGLTNYYTDSNKILADQMSKAAQGMQFTAPAKQTNLSALEQMYAPKGTNISQGSAEQAQLASLLASQNVARQAQAYGIGPTVARAGAPGINAPRFTSSGNIYSAGFYSPEYGSATQPAAFGAPSMALPPPPVKPMASGGISHLGGYSDGGRLLRGPGDGVSDSIPASIGDRQPARLADGEFVVPARIVSEIGNGSTEAGARKLYAMMDRVQKARKKSVGKNKVAVNSKADKYLPA